jgi:pantoate kinase
MPVPTTKVLDKVKESVYIGGMAATPESKVKDKIKTILKKHGVYFAMPIGTMYGNSGVPDFLCCVAGHFLAIEAKAGKGKTTALQDKHIREIMAQGGTAMVINETNINELDELLEKLK